MKKTLLALSLAFTICLLSAYSWKVALTDSYGDGWNGGLLTVYVNGNPVYTNLTLADGTGPVFYSFPVANGDGVTTDYTPGGWPYENSYYIYDHNDNLVAVQGLGEIPGDITEPIIVSLTGMLSPDNFAAVPISESEVYLSWLLNPDANPVMLAWSADGVFGDPVADYIYSAGEDIAGGGHVIYVGTNTSFNHSSLANHTTYYYKIWSYAESKAVSYSYGPTANATTFYPPVTSFPYLTDFDYPTGWTTDPLFPWLYISSGNFPVYPYPVTPVNMAMFNCWVYQQGATGLLMSPPLNLPFDNNTVQFWMNRDNNGYYTTNYDRLNVFYSTTSGLSKSSWLLGTFYRHMYYSPVEDVEGWHQYTLTLPAGSQGDYRFIIFQGVSDYGQDIYIDDVIVNSGEGQVPVELSSFTAALTAQNLVKLSWVTQSETGVQGYYLYRSNVDSLDDALLISPLIEAANSSEQHSYSYTDSELNEEGTYYYWLQNVDLNGNTDFHGPVSVNYTATEENITPEIPVVTELKHIFPNPFSSSAVIPFGLKESARVQIRIFNQRGQLLRHFDLAEKAAGSYQIAWDGKDANGSECGSGIYYFVMQAGSKTFQRKAVLFK